VVWLGVEPRFDSLRADSRFQQLLGQINSGKTKSSASATTLIDMPPTRVPASDGESAAHKDDEPHTTSPSFLPQTAEVGVGAVQFKSWNSFVAALAGAAVVAVVALGIYYFKDAQLFGVKMPSVLTRLTGNIATDSQPRWSPDNSKLVFTSYRDGKPEIYTMDSGGETIIRLTHNSADDFTPAWSPDGGKIAFTSKRDGNDEIYLMNADGSNQTNISNNAANDSRPAWSPDGKRLVFTSDRDDPSDNFEIYVMDADGSNVVRLTDSAGLDSDPNWSPDGKRIAFASDRDGNFEIYLMNADGSGQKNFSNNPAFDGKPVWSPGDARIAFISNRGNDPKNFEVWVADEDGRDPQNITNNPAVDDEPAWSPDGSTVAFQSERDGNFEIYVTPARADGGAARQANTGAIVKSLAVLPFKVGGASAEDAYMGVGLADALTARLGQLKQISVRPASAVRRYLASTQNAREVGREMGVNYVVDGRIERGGDRVAVSFQLTDVNDGSVLWAEKYDEKFTDITTVQSLISERVTRAMTLELTNDEQRMLAKRYTENSEAYQLYLAGRYHWGKRTAEALKQAIYLFEQAIQKDKNYALAYAGLADCYALLSWYVAPPPPDAFPKAKEAATRAIQLDESLAEAHASLAFVKLYYERDWTGAEREFRRAIELNPSYATAHHWFAFNLAAMGRHDAALAEIRVAQELDPRSLIINTAVANILYYARRYDEAIEQCQRTLETDPGFVPAHMILRGTYSSEGMHDEAAAVFRREQSYAGDNPGKVARFAHLSAAAGKRAEALKALDELRRSRRQQPVFAYEIAVVYSLLNEPDEAFAWLARAEAERSIGFAFVKVDPDLDRLRPDPRFNALLERIGLAE
jgi:Tol biopolymer transport system component/tetratricopeptide (TPR) repeat protein